MKKTSSFAVVVTILSLVLSVAELFSQRRVATILALSATITKPVVPTATPLFDRFPTRPPMTISPTSIPLLPTYTSIAGETPADLATSTLLPIDTPTLISSETPLAAVFTPTLILFATPTFTPFRGSPTPPVGVAYALDGKPTACRKGPSLAYAVLDEFGISRIAGKNLDSSWWYLLVSKGQGNYISCWVSAKQVTTGGNLDTLPVVEPEISDISQAKIGVPGQADLKDVYEVAILCDDGLTSTTLHFTGQVFANGPLNDIGYRWSVNAPVKFKVAHTSIKSWDAPAQTTLDLPIPSIAATYILTLRTTFPVEVLGVLQVVVKCR